MIVGGLIVLALTVALVGPYFVDWTSYRAEFEREASRILGRQVTVNGDASARLLPFPSVTFHDVSVAGAHPDEPSVTAETFSMDAELAPFLRGEVLIFDMRLVRPRIEIAIADDGKVDWAAPAAGLAGPRHITIEAMTVTDGEVVIRHAPSGREHRISGIDGAVSARSLAGPWRMEGTMALDGVPATVTLSTGTIDESGRARVRFRASPHGFPLSVEAEGDARVEDGRLTYGGTFRFAAHGSIQPRGEAQLRPAAPDYRMSGVFALDHQRLDIKEFMLETGPVADPYVAEGNAALEFGAEPRFRVVADGAQIRFDEAVEGAARDGAMTLDDRLAALRGFVERLPIPGMNGEIVVNLPAVIVGDTTIRDVRMSASPADQAWQLSNIAAQLPGRTTLEASGLLRTGESFGFTGSLLLAVAQPSGFAAWLSREVDDAVRRLPAAGFLSLVELTERRQVFRELELILGASRFRGRLESRQPADARPVMEAQLEGGALDVDGLAAFMSLFVSDAGDYRITDRDVDLTLKAGPVQLAGMEAGTVDTALRLREGGLEIDRLAIGDLAGASIGATGRITAFGDRPTGELDATVEAEDLAPLIDMVAGRFPANRAVAHLKDRADAVPGLFADAKLDIEASALDREGRDRIGFKLSGTAGETALNLSLAGDGIREDVARATVALDITASNPDAAGLFALYGLPTLPLGLAGSAETSLTAIGSLAAGLETRFALQGVDGTARFAGRVSLENESLSIRGDAGLQSEDIEPWLMTLGAAIPGIGLGMPVDLAVRVDLAEGLLVMAGLEGAIGGVALGGDLNLRMTEGRPALSGALQVDQVDLALPAAMILGPELLDALSGEDPDTVFADTPEVPATAVLDMAVGRLMLGDLVIEDAQFEGRLDPDAIRIADLRGRLHGGVVSGLLELRNSDGTGLLSGQATLSGGDLALMLPQLGIEGEGDFGLAVTAGGKSIPAMIAALGGSGTASLRDIAIPGLDPGALPAIIATADAIGVDIDEARTESFAPARVTDGTFRAASADMAFTIAGGVLRAPPLRIETPQATLTAELRADLAEGTVHATGQMAYAPGPDELVGSAPTVTFAVDGPLTALRTSLDTAPLAQFLTQRALEKEQARVEAMQSLLLERQRLRREVAYFAARAETRRRIAEEMRREEEELRLRMEEEERRAREVEEGALLPPEPRAAAAIDTAATVERQPLPPPPESVNRRGIGSFLQIFGSDGRSIDSILRDSDQGR